MATNIPRVVYMNKSGAIKCGVIPTETNKLTDW